mgnify:CR=1 FL=1
MIKLKRNIILFSISVFLLISCTSSQYIEPKQLDAETSAKSILSNNINDQKLIAYLSRYNLIIPDKDDYWNSDLLVMIALFNNKNLEMKRAEYGLVAADIQVITAGFKNNIGVHFKNVNTVAKNDTDNDLVITDNNYTVTIAPSVGTLELRSDGSFTYTPPTQISPPGPEIVTFEYEITDPDPSTNCSDKATVTIRINSINGRYF